MSEGVGGSTLIGTCPKFSHFSILTPPLFPNHTRTKLVTLTNSTWTWTFFSPLFRDILHNIWDKQRNLQDRFIQLLLLLFDINIRSSLLANLLNMFHGTRIVRMSNQYMPVEILFPAISFLTIRAWERL